MDGGIKRIFCRGTKDPKIFWAKYFCPLRNLLKISTLTQKEQNS